MNKVEERFCGLITQLGKVQGMDELSSKLFSLMYLEPEEITMEELAKKTNYSLASISNKIRLLEATGMIKKTKKPGSKKIYYYMNKDIIKSFEEVLIKKQQYVLKNIKEEMPKIINEFKTEKLSTRESKELILVESYYNQTLAIENVLEKMLKEVKKINNEKR